MFDKSAKLASISGTPGGIRTHDHRFRSFAVSSAIALKQQTSDDYQVPRLISYTTNCNYFLLDSILDKNEVGLTQCRLSDRLLLSVPESCDLSGQVGKKSLGHSKQPFNRSKERCPNV